jgi:hypothetical protein
MATLYLIANNSEPSFRLSNYVKKLKFKDQDVVITFNKSDVNIAKTVSRVDISCHRHNSITESHYFGVGNNLKMMKNPKRAKKYFFLGHDDEKLPKILKKNKIKNYNVHNPSSKLRFKDLVFDLDTGKEPTTGMFYIFYCLNTYPDHNIQLVGFNFFKNNRKTFVHDYVKESDIVLRMVEQSYLSLVILDKTPIINLPNLSCPTIIHQRDYEDTTEYPVIVSIYTTDNGYERYALSLISSLNKFNLTHYIEGHETKGGTWDEITKYKPYVLMKAMEKYPGRAVVWVDADATFEKMPTHFLKIKKDFAVHYVDNMLASGVVYFSNSDVGRNILTDWIVENNSDVKIWDQAHLSNLIDRKYIPYREFLPKDYCCIFDRPGYDQKTRVIAQWQASRTLKKN